MIKRLQTLKIRRIQWGAIRYRRQIRLRERRMKSLKEILHRLLPKIKAILCFLRIPVRILILVIPAILRRLQRSNWSSCEAN